MFTAKFSVQPVDQGWAVRVGPDVLVRFPTKQQALLDANFRIEAIRREGGDAAMVEEPPAAGAESGPAQPASSLASWRSRSR